MRRMGRSPFTRTARVAKAVLSLRTREGLDATRFSDEFDHPPRHFFDREIESLIRTQLLLETASGDLALTPRGRLLSDSVFTHFV